jgi:colanic acid/amylovoran biosynthesis glycosyltransferase
MRIVYVVDEFPSVSETFVLGEVRELLRRGEDVTVVSRRRPDGRQPVHEGSEEALAATEYIPRSVFGAAIALLVRRPLKSVPALWWCIRAAMRERGAHRLFAEAAYALARGGPVDHVHAHFAHGSASLALILARVSECRFSFTAHGYDVLVASRPVMLRRKVQEAAEVVTPAEFMRRRVRGVVRTADGEKIVVIRNGIDLRSFMRLHTPASPPLLLAVARLVEKKGLDTAIRASSLLAERGIQVRLDIVGEGPLRPKLEHLVAKVGFDAVRLLGAQRHETVQAALSSASVFVLPCQIAPNGDCDALPVALVEALAAGVPVVTTAVGGIPELIEDGVSGIIVEPGDPAAVAAAVERLLTDSELRERIISGGREAVRPYELAATVNRLRELFARAAATR